MPQLFCCGRVRGLRRGDTTRSVQNRAGPVCSKRDILRGSLSRGGAVPAAIDFKAVPGIGAEIVLTVDGEMRKTRLFRCHQAGGAGRRDGGHADDVRGQGLRVTIDAAPTFARVTQE
jgi:hypothetical protein